MSKHISVKQANMLNRNRYILTKLAKVNAKDRKSILNNAPSELFKVFNLIFKILRDGNLKFSNKQQQKLKKHKRFIQQSSDLKSSAIKRKIQNQRGGFLPAILSAALPIIGSIVKSIL